jgi:hypothetical protein
MKDLPIWAWWSIAVLIDPKQIVLAFGIAGSNFLVGEARIN